MKTYFEKNTNSQLIHVTQPLCTIISILREQNLRLGYCKEEFCITNDKPISKSVHPMVSFTEQDITQLETAEITYGKYGIAFHPNWIIKKNIQPVMYVEQHSPVAHSLAKLLIYRRKLRKGNLIKLPIMTTKCFVKNTIGYNRHGKGIHNFLFKQENEWRYVPRKEDIGNGYISETIKTYENNKKKYDDKILKHPLRFNLDEDVIYVYHEFETDKKEILDKFPQLENRLKITPWKYSNPR